ncbi:DUF3253 domain-containing protein [Chthonobacter albigriseus]|uniref:DUF3253 domain-containing protein n=1 Tax=Chthonobacter albigriseus TaxID=1683161 RepID=UPI0015EE3AF1|nr:DUF3253 domain-containing protein [Chthonobacter albigriseus]
MIDPKRVKAAELREKILELAEARSATGGKVDPMEVAVAIAGKDEKLWRRLMKPIKDEVSRLALDGAIVVVRKKKAVDPKRIRGLYRFRKLAAGEEPPVFEDGGDDDLGDDPDDLDDLDLLDGSDEDDDED